MTVKIKKSTLGLLGVGSYLVFLIAQTPAAAVLPWVSLPPQVQLGAVKGSLWSGEVQDLSIGGWQLSELRWRSDFSSLWKGQLRLHVDSGQLQQQQQPYLQLQASASFQGLKLEASNLRWPIAQLLSQVQLPMPVDASGALQISIHQFNQGTPYCSTLAGEAKWLDAKFKAPTGWIDLQSIAADLSCEQGNVRIVTRPDNPLSLQVTLDLDQANYRLHGSMKPAEHLPPEVHQAMQFVGVQDPQGRFPITLQGQLTR